MPITQDRMIALLDIIETQRNQARQLEFSIRATIDEATAEFYAAETQTELASNMLAHLQSLLATAISTTTLSAAALTILIREQEHFRLHRSRNINSARSMARRRQAASSC